MQPGRNGSWCGVGGCVKVIVKCNYYCARLHVEISQEMRYSMMYLIGHVYLLVQTCHSFRLSMINASNSQRNDSFSTLAMVTFTDCWKNEVLYFKAQDVWVTVNHLKSSDGGILDSDDTVADVVDDKEQISAVYDVGYRSPHQNNGDGTSASSVGTSSPDVFHSGKDYHGELRDWERAGDYQGVLITEQDLVTDSSLTVRRGSEPSLEVIRIDSSPKRPYASTFDPGMAKSARDKLISHQGVGDVGSRATESASRANNDQDSPGDSFNDSAFRAFMRTASRKSLNNGTAMMKWLEAQERVQDGFTRKTREEPIGSSDEAEIVECKTEPDIESPTGTLVEIRNSGCPLGIHVMPSFDENNRNLGLDIIEIEPDGLAGEDGRLNVNDCIVEINSTSLIDLDYSSAQEVFLNALKTSVIQLRIRPSNQRPIPPSSQGGTILPVDVVTDGTDSGANGASTRTGLASDGKLENADNVKTEPTAVPAKSTAGPARNPTTMPSTKSKFAPIASTRIIGQILKISLKKGNDGLGFSVTTRDNPAGGDCPIYIKNILPHGAAILDGRLRSGDRLLEVNGTEMSGKSQTDTVAILREVKVGGTVDLVVSRLNDDDQSQETTELLTKEQDGPKEKTGPEMNQVSAEQKRRSPLAVVSEDPTVFHLKIPVAGHGSSLGIHLTGKTDQDGRDIGLFVKLIVEGGAAAKDGQLQTDDNITEINGESLLGFSNVDAMNILLKAMTKDISKEGVSLTVSRATTKEGAIKQLDVLQKMNNNKTVSRSGDQEPLSSANNKNMPPPSGQISNHLADGSSRISDGRLGGSKVWRNMSYMMATDESLLNEINEGRDADEVKTGSTFPAQVNGRLSRYEMSGLNGRPISHCSSLSDCDGRELVKRTSVSTRNSDQDSECSSQHRARGFERDGFGRRSMSEKRRAYVDPKSSALYQKLKDGKGQSEGTTLKRTGSVESLLGENQRTSEKGGRQNHANSRAKRSTSVKKVANLNQAYPGIPTANCRMWNESFRVAVDRSYGNQVLSVPHDSHTMNSNGSQGRGQGLPLGQDPYVQGVNDRSVSRNPPPYQLPRQSNVTATHGFPQASTGQQPGVTTRRTYGQNEYYYNSSNRQTEQHMMPAEVGYYYYSDVNSARKLNDPYIRSSNNNHVGHIVNDPRSRIYDQSSREHPTVTRTIESFTQNVEQFKQHHPRSGPRAASPPRSQPHSTTWNQSTPSRTVTTPSNRPVRRCNNFREIKMADTEPPTGDNQPNNYMICDSYPNLTSIPSGYLNDVTNMTKSSRDLSALRGMSQGTRGVVRTSLDPWIDSRGAGQGTAVGGSLNRMMNDTQRQNGFTISSGALV